MELKPLPSAQDLWGHVKHVTGDSDGPAYSIAYTRGISSMPDNMGHVFVRDKKKKRRGKRGDGSDFPPFKDPSTQEVKNAIDMYGTHSFHFDCGYYLYDSGDEGRTQVLNNREFCMRPTKQIFMYEKLSSDGYLVRIVKFNTVSLKKVLESRCIIYQSTPDSGWISD